MTDSDKFTTLLANDAESNPSKMIPLTADRLTEAKNLVRVDYVKPVGGLEISTNEL